MIKFFCDGEEGIIDQFGFVRFGGCGFHIEDITPSADLMVKKRNRDFIDSIVDAYLKELFDTIRI